MADILSLNDISLKVAKAKDSGKTVITTNGCFDLLHYGHLHYFEEAKNLGDILIVGVNSDSSVKKLKGSGRPINSEHYRASLVAGLKPVDYVFIFSEPDPINFLETLKPNIHVKGGDYSGKIIESDVVEKNGGKIQFLSEIKGVSTTNIIKKIILTYKE